MAKVFTITQGLENLGALKTGGQGSVYKGRRDGNIITAVKILPTPIHTESEQDRNYRDFNSEVQKLKKVNEIPNPNIVKILSAGLSETGSFPFIEMEFIEGPDLEELLKFRHSPVFTLKVVTKVARHLSNALAHCHSLGVKHGDIKSNNVKLNIQTGQYVLLDFGLAIMSDEQRRTSLRRAGAVEFMAPEQNEGQMLFQTDVYSFGIVLFELLTGRVPFSLKDGGETARNNVRLAHQETSPPDIITLRKKAIQATWTPDIRERELQLPKWLPALVYKCLSKRPEDRFADGVALNNYIIQNTTNAIIVDDTIKVAPVVAEKQFDQKEMSRSDGKEPVAIPTNSFSAVNEAKSIEVEKEIIKPKRTSFASFIGLFTLVIVAIALLTFFLVKNANQDERKPNLAETRVKNRMSPPPPAKKITPKRDERVKAEKADNSPITEEIPENLPKSSQKTATTESEKTSEKVAKSTTTTGTRWTVKSIAHFHNAPDESTRRAAFINHWNNAVLVPQDEQNGFIYIVYKNDQGQTSKGWLKKDDLRPIK
jgi:serine/threonine protein kinase